MTKQKQKEIVKPGEKNSEADRRNARRFDITWEVNIKGTDNKGLSFDEAGALLNLSSNGAFLYIKRELHVGAKVDVLIKIPFKRENWMEYKGEVVRVERDKTRVGVAMKFDAPRPTFIVG
jgi:hypothetical protein